jgi:hypothetical protein
VEENKRRDAENTKLKARIEELESENVEFRDRITKVEQRQMLNDPKGNNSSSILQFGCRSGTHGNVS